jgi:hypothetical protein
MPIRKPSDEMYDEPDDQQERLDSENSDEAASAVGLLPRTILMGKDAEVGDEIVLKITGLHDDQIEVAYPGESSESDSEEEPVPAETAEAPVAEVVPAGAEMYE